MFEKTVEHGIGWFLFQTYKWLFVIPFFVVLTIIFGSLAIILSFIIPPRLATYCGVAWAKLTAYASFMSVAVSGREHVDAEQSYVIVANHQSAYDIITIYGWLGIDFRWVMKQEMRMIPFLGFACHRIGHVFINRKNHQSAIDSLEKAKQRIHSGISVLFFPEGTRTQSSALSPFKKGAFKMALDLGLPVLPVTLNGADKVMPTKTVDLMPGHVDMLIHPSIATAGMTEADIETLMQQSFEAIDSALPEEVRNATASTD